MSYNNLKSVYDSQGKHEEVMRAHRKALQIQLKVLDGNLGCVYDIQGMHEKALEAHRKALEIQLKVLGPEHPKVA